jgi:hypothetical protein
MSIENGPLAVAGLVTLGLLCGIIILVHFLERRKKSREEPGAKTKNES